jgi:hypothetical protein
MAGVTLLDWIRRAEQGSKQEGQVWPMNCHAPVVVDVNDRPVVLPNSNLPTNLHTIWMRADRLVEA